MPWQWHKPKQGYRIRLTATIALALLSALAAAELYTALVGSPTHIRLALPVVLLVALVGPALYLLNRPRVADFLIETQGELARVSWPSRQQVIGSTGAVLVLVLLLSGYLLVLDKLVDLLLREVLPVYHR